MTKQEVSWQRLELGRGNFASWRLFLYDRQNPHIGSAYAVLRRPAKCGFEDVSPSALTELQRIQQNYSRALHLVFGSHHMEYVAPHNAKYEQPYQLFIPRYKGPRLYAVGSFYDAHFGKPYGSFPRARRVSEEQLLKIHNILFGYFPND